MSKIIISLIGYGGSGKTSAAKYLEDTYGFAHFTFSGVIRNYAAEHGIALHKRTDYANTHIRMIKEHGWDYTLRMALRLPSERICIDDLRSKKYVDEIRKAGGKEIAFDCPTDVRFAHVHAHPDKAKYPSTLEEFIKNERDDEAIELAPGLTFDTAEVIQTAHYHIDASGTLEHTLEQLDKIVKTLL